MPLAVALHRSFIFGIFVAKHKLILLRVLRLRHLVDCLSLASFVMALRHTSRLLALGRHHVISGMSDASTSSNPAMLRSLASLWRQPECPISCRHISTYPSLAASVKVPSMGESIEEGTISAILKQEGDAVEMDEAMFQIETDKVTVDVRASEAGVVDKIMVRWQQAFQL